MIISAAEKVPLEKCPALVLNADFRPLSYYPLSLWCWQDAVKSVFLERVSIVSNYRRKVRSPSFEMNLPSVIALKNFIKQSEHPSFTRFNVFLRDKFNNPKVILTPHVAASTTEASIVVAEMAANQISDFLLKGTKINTVLFIQNHKQLVHPKVLDQTRLIWAALLIFDLQNQSHLLFVLQIKQNQL